MILATVTGAAVASEKHFKLEGRKLLVVQPIQPSGAPKGDPLIAIDGNGIGAGEGDQVLVVQEGRCASILSGRDESPLDAAVVAIVDSVDLR